MMWRWAFPIALAPWALTLLVLGLGHSGSVAGPEDNLEWSGTSKNVQTQSWKGSGSCAGRGCHGNVDVAGTLGTEYNTWINLDKHSGAFQVLSNDVSEAIQDRLGVKKPATQDDLCLSCHGHPAPQVAGNPSRVNNHFQPIGIGCESCHGPAGNWLDDHYQANWKSLSVDQKADKGMNSLLTSTQRARVCVGCHVGKDLERQVHHDLIAAGHPRLNFEFSSAMSRMPRHWAQSKNEPEEAQAWAVGQAVSLEATLQLLQNRANAAFTNEKKRDEWKERGANDLRTFPKPTQPWPEFSDYSCFACHHDLRDAGVRYLDVRAGLQSGTPLAWNTWGLPMVRALAEYDHQSEWLEQLNLIEELMQSPYPNPEQVALAAEKANQGLKSWIKTLDSPDEPFSKHDLYNFLSTIEPDSEQVAFQNVTAHWDAAAQFYFALRALERAELVDMSRRGIAPTSREREFHDRLNQMVKYLRFPEGQNSPGDSAEPSHQAQAASNGFLRIAQETLEQMVRLAPGK